MKKQRNPYLTVLALCNILALGTCITAAVYSIISADNWYYVVMWVLDLIALFFSALYLLGGYRKDSARYYRLFMLISATTYIAEALAYSFCGEKMGGVQFIDNISPAVTMLLYGNILILAVAKDLKKKVSYALCIVNMVAYIVPVVYAVIPGLMEFGSAEEKAIAIFLYITWELFATIALIMTIGKYRDKESRNAQ